jgi:outer membrane receptor protein involved in Fe transport
MSRPTGRTAGQCGIAVAIALLFPFNATAQVSDDQSGSVDPLSQSDIDEIIVTGSRISRENLESPSPLLIVSDEVIQSRAPVNIENVLNLYPQIQPDLGSEVNNGGNGTATVDLRGLEPKRTLVLINGRRMVPATNKSEVDIDAIPLALIERVDIVTGGASAVYGSDAMAGVVNFIMKNDFEGFQLDGTAGVSRHWDAQRYGVSATFGSNFSDGRGNVTMSVGYTQRQGLLQSERSFSAIDQQSNGSSVGPAGRLDDEPNNCFGGGICDNPNSGPYAFNPDGTIRPFINQLPELNGGVGDRYNFAPANYQETPQERFTIAALGHFDLNDHVQPYAEAYYVNNETESQLAPTPMAFPSRALPLTNPLLQPDVLALAATRPDPTAPLLMRRRMVEVGNRQDNYEFDEMQLVLGARGNITGTWNWDSYYSYGRTTETESLFNDLSAIRVDAALAGCPPGNLVPDCRAVNFFGPGNISPEDAAWLNAGLVADDFEFERNVYSLTASGEAFDLPAGPLRTAVGYEWREDRSKYFPGAPKEKGDIIGFNAQQPISGSDSVKEIFAEVRAPLIADRPGVQLLDLEAAWRFSDYESVGGEKTYKIGAEWTVVPDLMVRVMFNEAVRAPNIFELYQAGDEDFPSVDDPCATTLADGSTQTITPEVEAICTLQGLPPGVPLTQSNSQVQELDFGNPDLQSETAETWTYGVVLQPRQVENLAITIDYFDIEIEDYIDKIFGGPNGLVNDCFASGITTQAEYNASLSCSNISRNASGELSLVVPLGNVSKVETTGIDTSISYAHDFGAIGALSLIGNITWLDTWKLDGDDFAGTSTFDRGTLPEWRSNLRLGWTWRDLDVSLNWQFIDSVDDIESFDDPGTPEVEVLDVDAQSYLNLSASYQVTEPLRVTFIVENLTDNDPPLVLNGVTNTNTDNTIYDTIGRYYAIAANLRF